MKDRRQFPKTSLPSLEETQNMVDAYVNQGDEADKSYGLIASYTYNKGNMEDVIQMLPQEYKEAVSVYDDLCHSIACHWGPNAYGFIYVKSN